MFNFLNRHYRGKARFGDDIDELTIPTSLDETVETLQSDDAVGEMGTPQDDYGQADTGASFDTKLGPGNGGLDPFALASFGDDPADAIPYDGTMDPAWSLDDTADDLPQAYQPTGPDTWDFPEQVATLRHPLINFGGEFYPYHGPAAVFGTCGELKK